MRSQKYGFTLLELIFVIVILGVIAAIASKIIGANLNAYFTNQNVTSADWQARLAFERLSRDLHAINSPNTITTATASQLSFSDINGNAITYDLSGSSLMRNSQILADGVNSLAFSYLDRNAVSTTVTSDIAYVIVTLNITLNNVNYTTRTTISPLNFH